MTVETKDRIRVGNAHQHFLAHVATMPRSYKLVLLLAFALAAFGGVGWAVSHGAATTAEQSQSSSANSSVPASHSGFVGDTGMPSPTQTSATTASQPDGLIAKLSPNATRIGVSVVIGFILGWIFRAFLKTMAFFCMLGAAILFALSYFGVLNVDFSAAREHYASAVHWLTDQSTKLKDAVLAHLPSSGGGAVGAFLGFRRR